MSYGKNESWLSAQWASRPADERFENLDDLLTATRARKAMSRETIVRRPKLDVTYIASERPNDQGEVMVALNGAEPYRLSHHAFGQLCTHAGAPASYLRGLPAPMAAMNLGWGLQSADIGVTKVLTQGPAGEPGSIIRAFTSDGYGRIWDADVAERLAEVAGRTGWRVPDATYAGRDPKRASTLFSGDRDSLMFLANPELRRDGGSGSLIPCIGIFNSEVGTRSFGMITLDVDYICDNRILWGVTNKQTITFRHTSGAPIRFVSEVAEAMARWCDPRGIAARDAAVAEAKRQRIATDAKAAAAFLKAHVKGIADAAIEHVRPYAESRGFDPLSIWGTVQALTDYSHRFEHQDTRFDFDAEVAKLLRPAVAAAGR